MGLVSISRKELEQALATAITALAGVTCRCWRDTSTVTALPAVVVHVFPIRFDNDGTNANLRACQIELSVTSDPHDDATTESADAICDSLTDAISEITRSPQTVVFTGGKITWISFDDTDEQINEDGYTVATFTIRATIAQENAQWQRTTRA
jgi:hypothetical protein